MKTLIYLDHNATTPLDEAVLDAMLPFLREEFGNAASRNHVYGQRASEAVNRARRQAATLIGAQPKEIIWTSGATEANNLAIFGAIAASEVAEPHVITQATEHPAVLDPCQELERRGVVVTRLKVDGTGRTSAKAVRDALRPGTVLVSIMTANNETGVLQPIREIGQTCHEAGVLFHTDAAQAVGKTPLDVEADHIDLLSISAHKVYGPKGVGALYVRSKGPRVRLLPIIWGGGHERGMRSGTINVPGVVGLGRACEIAAARLTADWERLSELRDRLEEGLLANLDNVEQNGSLEYRLPHVSNLRFDGVEAESLLMTLDEIAASTGAACSSMKMDASHVLLAMGLDEQQAFNSVRFSLGRNNVEAEVDHVIDRVVGAVTQLRSLNLAD